MSRWDEAVRRLASRCLCCPVIALAVLAFAGAALADEVEYLSGIRVRGKILRETKDTVILEVAIGDMRREMTIEAAKIHAITVDGSRRVINEKPGQTSAPPGPQGPAPGQPTPPQPAPGLPADPPGEGRTPAEISALVDQAGRTPPDWWDSVPLSHPKTLDLTWPQPSGGWDPQKHIGHYLTSVVNPNPNQWRPAVKLLHQVLKVNESDRAKQIQAINELARLYGQYLEDYPRAIFLIRRSIELNGGTANDQQLIRLGEYYLRLGCKSLAEQAVSRLGRDTTVTGALIKLRAELGDLPKALVLAEEKARGGMPDVAYLAAGHACRHAGDYTRAMDYYRKVLALSRGTGGLQRNQTQARAGLETVQALQGLDLSRIPDGTYRGTGVGFRGDVQVAVTVQAGRITAVKVTNHREDWPGASMTAIPRQVVEKQGIKGVDAITGATFSCQGVIAAVGNALAGAMKS